MTRIRKGILGGLALAMLAGCATRDPEPTLMHAAQAHRGPDEFAILPTRPLQAPPDYNALPQPTPGGSNLVDPDPRADAYAALGGRGASTGAGVPASDAALLAHASRHGVQSGIREQLAAEDLEFRQRNRGRLLERLMGVNVYHRTYRREQGLDQHAELDRWRVGGRRTPSAPPEASR
ncbi:DUF3035 domain-containing protein [Pararhodobacter sp. SW119]|uniref:DUF3035 domain-containing protein n=1 Tax=Pararhodobacter sp. SW119 TaxID=2780075 RepID=UPI001AE00881|nr:DUF3035 domain-containing protein [Pararhodobacter sp. SW119]